MAQRKAKRKKQKRSQPVPAPLRGLFERPASGPRIETVHNMVLEEGESGRTAKWGVYWEDSQYPIFFQLLVNGQFAPPPLFGEDGAVEVPIVLKPGKNRLDWSIRHTGQGWRNQAWLQVGQEPAALLKEDSDPSDGTSDDVSRARNVRVEA